MAQSMCTISTKSVTKNSISHTVSGNSTKYFVLLSKPTQSAGRDRQSIALCTIVLKYLRKTSIVYSSMLCSRLSSLGARLERGTYSDSHDDDDLTKRSRADDRSHGEPRLLLRFKCAILYVSDLVNDTSLAVLETTSNPEFTLNFTWFQLSLGKVS